MSDDLIANAMAHLAMLRAQVTAERDARTAAAKAERASRRAARKADEAYKREVRERAARLQAEENARYHFEVEAQKRIEAIVEQGILLNALHAPRNANPEAPDES